MASFSQSFIFCKMNFCNEGHLFCKGTFIIWEKSLFLGMCSTVPFASRSLASVDFHEKFFLLFSPLGNAFLVLQNTNVQCLG